MSLINQMLKDLEKRPQASEGMTALPDGVRGAPQAPAAGTAARRRGVLVLLLGVLLVGGYAAYRGMGAGSPAVPEPLAAVNAPPEAPAEPVEPAPAQPSASVTPPPAAETEAAAQPRRERADKASAGRAAARAPRPVEATIVRPLAGVEQDYQQALEAYGVGRSQQSMALARKVLASQPEHLGARQLLMRLLMEQGGREELLRVVEEGLARVPGQSGWAALLVRLRLDKGQLDEAAAAVARFLPSAGGDAQFQSLAAALAQRQVRHAEAADHYRAALRLVPGEGRNWVGLGVSLEALGHQPEALEAYRRAERVGRLDAALQAFVERKLKRAISTVEQEN